MNRRVRFLSRLTSFSYRSSRGEIATTAVLIGIGIIALGVVVSRLISQQPGDQDTRSMAALPVVTDLAISVPVINYARNNYTIRVRAYKNADWVAQIVAAECMSTKLASQYTQTLTGNCALPTGGEQYILWLQTLDPAGNAVPIGSLDQYITIVSGSQASYTFPNVDFGDPPPVWTRVFIDITNPVPELQLKISAKGASDSVFTPCFTKSISSGYPAGPPGITEVEGICNNLRAESYLFHLDVLGADGTPTGQTLEATQTMSGDPLAVNLVVMKLTLPLPPTPTNTPIPPGSINVAIDVRQTSATKVKVYIRNPADAPGVRTECPDANGVAITSGTAVTIGCANLTRGITYDVGLMSFSAALGWRDETLNTLLLPLDSSTPTTSFTLGTAIVTPQTLPIQVNVQNPNAQYNVFAQASVPGDGRACGGGRADTTPQNHSCVITSDKAWSVDVWAEGPAGVIKSQETQTAPIVIPAGGPYTQQNFTIVLPGAAPVCANPITAGPGGLTPPDNSTVTAGTQQITWNAVTGAGQYAIRINEDPEADGIWRDASGNQIQNCSHSMAGNDKCIDDTRTVTGGTLTSMPYTFTAGKQYRIWVHALSTDTACQDASHTKDGWAVYTASNLTVNTVTPTDPVLTVSGDGGDGTFNLSGNTTSDTISVTVTHNGLQASSVQKFDVNVYDANGGLVALGVTMNATYANGVSSATGTLPASIFTAGGTYKLKAGAYSSGNTLPDLGVSADVPITVALAGTGASVDLHVKSTTHTEPAKGIDVRTEIENLGTATWKLIQGDPFEIEFTLADATTTCKTVLDQNNITIGVAAGSVIAITNLDTSAAGWTCTPGALTLTAGTSYTLTTKLDPNNKQPESDENNNTNTYTFTYGSVPPGGKPDLHLKSSSHTESGATISLTSVVENIGAGAVSISSGTIYDMKFTVSDGTSSCYTSIDKTTEVNVLTAGGTVSVTTPVDLSAAQWMCTAAMTFTAGKTYTITTDVDPLTVVDESDESNNTDSVYTFTFGSGTPPIPTNGFTVTVNAPNGGEQLVAGTATTISWRARTTTAADVGQYDTIIRVNYDKVGGGTSHWTLCGEGTAPACPKSNVTGSVPGGTVTYSWTPTKAEIPANAKPATYKARVVLMPPTGYPPAQLKKDSNGFSYLDSDSSNAPFDIVDAGTVTNTPIPTLTGTTPAPGGTCQVTTNFDAQGGLTPSSPYTFNNTGDTRRLEVNATLADGRTVERICFTLAGGSGYARDDIWDGYIISTDDNCESVTTSDNTPDTRIYAVNSHTSSKPYSTLIMDVAVAQSGGYVRCTAERYFTVNSACGYDQQKGGDFNCDGTANKTDINFGKTLLKMLIRGAQATLGGFTRGELEELIASLQRK